MVFMKKTSCDKKCVILILWGSKVVVCACEVMQSECACTKVVYVKFYMSYLVIQDWVEDQRSNKEDK